jgi:hypothetical protein
LVESLKLKAESRRAAAVAISFAGSVRFPISRFSNFPLSQFSAFSA